MIHLELSDVRTHYGQATMRDLVSNEEVKKKYLMI
jgi:hypothetical protein